MIDDPAPAPAPSPHPPAGTAMNRITLARASGIVGVLAVGCGAMRAATDEGERIVFALVLAVHAAGLVGTALRRGMSPSWSGFSLFGWVFLAACATSSFDGPAGNTALPSSDLAQAAFKRAQPEPEAPVINGVSLAEELDKVTATDDMIKIQAAYQKASAEWTERERHVGAIADLLASILAALGGAWLGPRLAPRPEIPAPPQPDA